MSALKLVKDVRHVANLPAALTADPWAAASEHRRKIAEARAALVAPLAELVKNGASRNNVAKLFIARVMADFNAPASAHALKVLGTVGASMATLKRWISAYITDGKAGLLPKHTGRVRQDYGWEVRAVALYNVPSKPGFADVAWNLRGEGHATATESRVKRYLKALPATLGDKSPARIGKHLHRLTRQKYQRRSVEELLVGEVYAGDGHTADCYVAHPNTGKPFRPELTAFIDIKARYLAGWYFTESESAVSTLYALSAAMMGYDHVPAWLYIDRGAGYRAKMLSDDATGWYAKFDIEVIGALPGNPHGKGWIERWFRTVRDKHDKHFAGGQVYCGDDMAPETNRRLSAELASGRRTLPSYYDYVASFRRFVEQYHNEPMDVLGGRTPAQLWAELTPISVGLEADAVMRPSQEANLADSSALKLVSPVVGVDAAFTAASGVSGGADVEADTDASYRLQQRLAAEPMGGSPADYARWALAVPGITRAWGVRNPAGPTSAGVIIMADGNTGGGLPTLGQRDQVLDYIRDPKRGPPDELFIIIPTPVVINWVIHLSPDTSAIRTAVEAGLKDLFFREANPGGSIPHSHATEVISSVVGEYNHTISTPSIVSGGFFTVDAYNKLLMLGSVTFD